jgi:hypothetical protein
LGEAYHLNDDSFNPDMWLAQMMRYGIMILFWWKLYSGEGMEGLGDEAQKKKNTGVARQGQQESSGGKKEIGSALEGKTICVYWYFCLS